nr:immunoglobulin light chain junction region [Macaca mulatta]
DYYCLIWHNVWLF